MKRGGNSLKALFAKAAKTASNQSSGELEVTGGHYRLEELGAGTRFDVVAYQSAARILVGGLLRRGSREG
ncbi:hypothetical protein RvY_11863 [Ramazzottius varieornatus]|uniref:Uncharacterized protein n=1 Tax=Ramazzottius varieornatus TaxID=947166 RepID=A0A1D1VJX3_RAMVA|nr:hypothetical protein RvY_11863 [Ramazzottius varieornatus]